MNLKDISNIRLITQQISGTKFKGAKDIVGWMGAMQAQDYYMVKWAVGVRFPNSTDQMIQSALDSGEIIRTHLLRPTWHLVSFDDIHWMLELTAPNILSSLKSRNKELELTKSIFSKSNKLIGKLLEFNNYLTRDELIFEIEKAKIPTDQNRAYHLLLQAELEGIACSGPIKNNKQTYALLSERVPKTKILTKDEALEKLALRYFSSHGPATIQDFIWWSGLPTKDARTALETIKKDLFSETIDSETYWFTNSFPEIKTKNTSLYLLPAFDEFIISYKDRKASLQVADNKKAVSNNGIFRPVIVLNGQVIGIWKRAMKKNVFIIEIHLFRPVNKNISSLIEKEAEVYGKFFNKKTEVMFIKK